MRRTRPLMLAACSALALALGACEDDNEPTAGGSGGTTTPAKAENALRFVAPVDTSDVSDFAPQVRVGLDAALKEINDAGGVDGRPLQIDICKTDGTPDSAARCGREIASDHEVLASVGGFTLAGKGLVPELEKAGVASVGDYPIDAIGLESKISFPILSIQNGFLNAAVLPVGQLKGKKVDAVVLDAPAGRAAAEQIGAVLKAGGAELGRTVFIPVSAGDLSAQVQTLRSDKVDAIVTIIQDRLTQQFIQAYRQVDAKTPIVTTDSAFSRAFIKKLGDVQELYVGMQLARNSDGERVFQKSAAAVGDADIATALSRNSYLAVKLVADALDRAKEKTRDGLLAALHATDGFDSGGMTPPLDYTQARELFPRAALRVGHFGKVEDGEVKQLSTDFVPTLPAKAPTR